MGVVSNSSQDSSRELVVCEGEVWELKTDYLCRGRFIS
jgi:hypothetical protein